MLSKMSFYHAANIAWICHAVVTSSVTLFSCLLSRLTLQEGMTQHPFSEYLSRTGRTTTEIAKIAGCSRMTIYRLIRGDQNATINLLERVSAATNGEVPISAFLPVMEVHQ